MSKRRTAPSENDNHPRRVAVLTTDAGFGHRTASKAVRDALVKQYSDAVEVEVFNPMGDKRAPIIIRKSQYDYDALIRRAPELYRLGFEVTDGPLPMPLIDSTLTAMLFEVIWNTMRNFRPDCVVVTFPLYLPPLDALFTVRRRHIPVVTTVTDLATIHKLWYHRVADLTCVPTQTAYDLALQNGLGSEEVEITGIPINPTFAEPTDKRALRAQLGWRDDLPTLLVVGSKRVVHLRETLRALNHCGFPLQLALVAGGDDALYRYLQRTQWHHPTHIYNFVDNMPDLMRAADMIACKAGGLIVTESLASGLPILLVDVIEGQETGNMDTVVESGAGELTRTPTEMLEVVYHWLSNDHKLLKVRAANSRKLGRPRAALDVAERVYALAQTHPARRRAGTRKRDRLIKLLEQINVPWRDVAGENS